MFPCFFQLFQAACILCLLAPSSHHFNFLFPWSQPLLLTLTLLLPSYMDTWDYIEPNRKIQDSLSISKSFITSSKSLLPYKVTFTGSGGQDMDIWDGGQKQSSNHVSSVWGLTIKLHGEVREQEIRKPTGIWDTTQIPGYRAGLSTTGVFCLRPQTYADIMTVSPSSFFLLITSASLTVQVTQTPSCRRSSFSAKLFYQDISLAAVQPIKDNF